MAHSARTSQGEEYMTEATEDSGYYEDISPGTESVPASIYDHRFENGRRYHAYKEGSYFMPNDEPEQQRLNMQHQADYLALGRRNLLAPIAHPRRILDLGTGTGIWAVEMGDQFPSAEIVGLDLSPIQPSAVPPNVKFEVDDVEDNWTFPNSSFDLIFSRDMLAGSIVDFRRYCEQAYRHCRPGGYFEIHERQILQIRSDQYPPSEDSSIKQWCALMNQGIQVMGRCLDLDPNEITDLLHEVGFEDVTVTTYQQPIGQWPEDLVLRQSGAMQLLALLEGMEGLSLAVFSRCLHWFKTDTEALLERTRRELTMQRACYYCPGFVIHARKPEVP
ncbi:Methyltransferase pytC [Exophiala dermatitidis]